MCIRRRHFGLEVCVEAIGERFVKDRAKIKMGRRCGS